MSVRADRAFEPAPRAVPQILFGQVMHSRLRPHRNRFVYRVFFLRVPVERLDRLSHALLSVDRWNLFSLRRRDYGPRDGSDLELWIRRTLLAEGMTCAAGAIYLQTFPRMLGYAFNPISFWFCHDRDGGLRAVLCEVNNTFGEHHHYLIAHPDQRAIRPDDRLEAGKALHVSPFCEVQGHYRFRFATDEQRSEVRIDYSDGNGMLLATKLRGSGVPLTTQNLVRAFVLYPCMTVAVILRIHWQALKLWAKGVPFVAKPLPPSRELTR